MKNIYGQIIGLYHEKDRQKRGYAFEQLIREIQPWSSRPPISAKGDGEQLDGVYEWNGRIFIIEAKAKEGKIFQGSSDWEDFELKVRRRNKSVVGLFLSLYQVDKKIISQCEMMNKEGYSIFVIYGDTWSELYDNPISFELLLRYLMMKSRINYIATISNVMEVKKWYFHIEDIENKFKNICDKHSGRFLRRFKQDKHEELYVRRSLDEKVDNYLKNLFPKALSRTKKTKNRKSKNENITFEIEREIPSQMLLIRDVCGAGKTTFAVESSLSCGKYFSCSKSASENNIDSGLEELLSQFGEDYGLIELLEINRPVVFVVDSLDEARGIMNKINEIKSIISFLDKLNMTSRRYGFYAFPIAIIFTIREEYWRDWESLFEGMRVKHLFKVFSEFNDKEFEKALNNYQQCYHYKISNTLSKDDILTLSNPLNLFIFSETNKYMGNIVVNEVFTASVLHNFFTSKSEVVCKRGLQGITPRIFLDICENFLSMCVYKTLHLNKCDFYENLRKNFTLFEPYGEELLRIYESELIFHFDDENMLVIRHMKFFEYLYADYMIQKVNSLNDSETHYFLGNFIGKIYESQFVDLIEIYNNVQYLYSLKNCKRTVQNYLDQSNEFMKDKLSNLRCKIACGNEGRIEDFDQIVGGKNITDGNLLLEAFFISAAKCNNPGKAELLNLFLKAWKANKNNVDRWKLLPKLNTYRLIDERKVMAQIIKSTSWKEWQVYLGYLVMDYEADKFIKFMQESEECGIATLIKEGGEWRYVKDLLERCNNQK